MGNNNKPKLRIRRMFCRYKYRNHSKIDNKPLLLTILVRYWFILISAGACKLSDRMVVAKMPKVNQIWPADMVKMAFFGLLLDKKFCKWMVRISDVLYFSIVSMMIPITRNFEWVY